MQEQIKKTFDHKEQIKKEKKIITLVLKHRQNPLLITLIIHRF